MNGTNFNPSSQADQAMLGHKIAVSVLKKNMDAQKQTGQAMVNMIKDVPQMGVNRSKTGGLDIYG